MSRNARDRRPYIRPVTRLELDQSNVKLRWIAIAALLAVAVAAIGYGFSLALSTEPGWQEVTSISQQVNCGSEFKLMYDFTEDGSAATAKYKKLELLYTDLTEEGYRLFSPVEQGQDNLYALNAQVNTPVSVSPDLYPALEQIAGSESRHPYLGPVARLYWSIFLASTDGEAALYDPMKDPELARQVRETAAFCADPEMIRLEALGGNQVMLKVAPEYLDYARENGIDTFLDLGWMTNAFVADFIAGRLAREGYTKGYLASHDGFTRNLDAGRTYSINLFDRQGNDVLVPARLDYTGPMAIVTLRDYPLSSSDQWYYAYEDGSITTLMLDPADGSSKSATDSLVGYGRDMTCGQMLLELAPVFTAEALDRASLQTLAGRGIDTIWFEGTALCRTEENASLILLPDSGGAGYSLQ